MRSFNDSSVNTCLSSPILGAGVSGDSVTGNDATATTRKQASGRSEAEPRPLSEPGGEAAPLLEQEGKHCPNADQPPESCWEIIPCRCKKWFCPSCCTSQGIKLKDKLIAKLDDFEDRQMWTLTIDPKRFASPVDAYEHVKRTRAISKLVEKLKKRNRLYSGQYFVVVEFQKNGMVHYHIVLDTTCISHELVGKLWGLGFVFFTKVKHETAKGAAGYLCKYLIKQPENGYPDWVLDYPPGKQIRKYQSSKGFFPDSRVKSKETLLDECDADLGHEETDESEERERKPRRTIREALAECKQNSVLMFVSHEQQDDGTVKANRQFIAELPATVDVIAGQLLKPYTGDRLAIYERDLAKLVELQYKLPWQLVKPTKEPERIKAFDDYNARQRE